MAQQNGPSGLKRRLASGDVIAHDGTVTGPDGGTVGNIGPTSLGLGGFGPGDFAPEEPEPDTSALGEVMTTPQGGPLPVHLALAAARREIGIVGKGDRYKDSNMQFQYRGVERVVNSIRPILDRYGIMVIPSVVEANWRDVPRASGGRSHECTITMQYRFIGPQGDHLDAVVCGEALDTSDKATAKAQSVAWRVALIQVFALRTGDPDPDTQRIERGDAVVNPLAYRDEILDQRTSLGRLKQIRTELTTHRIVHTLVENENGDEETLWNMAGRIGKARQEAGEPDA